MNICRVGGTKFGRGIELQVWRDITAGPWRSQQRTGQTTATLWISGELLGCMKCLKLLCEAGRLGASEEGALSTFSSLYECLIGEV